MLRHAGFVAKMNRDELAATVGGNLNSYEEVIDAARFAAREGRVCIVTLGADGALVVEPGQAWRVTPPEVTAHSAVGSGDAFAAGLIAGIVRRQSIIEACTWAAACGAANAMTDLAGHLSRDDAESLRRRVRVEPVRRCGRKRAFRTASGTAAQPRIRGRTLSHGHGESGAHVQPLTRSPAR